MSYEDHRIDLIGAGAFVRGQLAEFEQRVIVDSFRGEVARVIARINDGKEATVYLCEAQPRVVVGGEPIRYLAAKMYRARKFRAFRSDQKYAAERPVRDRRMAKAMRQRTTKGAIESQLRWVDQEWELLNALHSAGVAVPAPVAHCDAGILMEFIGDDSGEGVAPAPMLSEVRLNEMEASAVWRQLCADIDVMLGCGYVHGDLSAYNVLLADGRPHIIDLPQAVGVRSGSAFPCLERDVANLARYFARAGLHIDVTEVVCDLWQRHGFA